MRATFNKSRLFTVFMAIATLLAFATASCTPDATDTGRIGVVVTIPPQVEFARSVGGDKVDVTVMLKPGETPHTYDLQLSKMATLSHAKMYAMVGSGLDYELSLMDRLVSATEDMLVVDCSEGVELQEMSHDHGGEPEHGHGAMDPHIWMAPPNAKIMVRNICDGLIKVDPDNRTYYERNLGAYIHKLEQLDREVSESLSAIENRVFMVYHPSLGYFASEYGFTMLAIEDDGKDPTSAGLTSLVEQAKEHNVKIIFAEPQFDPRSAEVIADAVGARVAFIDPLSADYMTNISNLAEELAQAVE